MNDFFKHANFNALASGVSVYAHVEDCRYLRVAPPPIGSRRRDHKLVGAHRPGYERPSPDDDDPQFSPEDALWIAVARWAVAHPDKAHPDWQQLWWWRER